MYLAHLEKLNRMRLADVLVEEGVLDRSRVEEAQAEQDATGKQLGQILIESDVLTDYDLAKIVVTHYSLPYLDMAGFSTRREVTTLLPEEFRHRWAIQPLDQFGSILTLAVSEIPSPEQIEEIVETTNLTPILFIAARRAVIMVIEDERKRSAQRKSVTKNAAQPAAAAPGAATTGAAATAEETEPAADGDPSLPEFDLPTVPMKLAGGSSPARPGGKPGTPGAAKAGQASALSWMDAVGGGKPAAHDPKAAKPQRPAPGAAPARPAAPPAKGAAPAAPANAGSGTTGKWQTMFDAADESVKKPKQ
jgi:hypothetical protein